MDISTQAGKRFWKKHMEIAAIKWMGGDYKCLDRFCGRNWSRADAVHECGPSDIENVVVWNTAEEQWLNLPVGHWLIRGIEGELYPCAPDIFEASYEPVPPLPLSARAG